MAQEPVIKIMKTASNNTLIFRCRGLFNYSNKFFEQIRQTWFWFDSKIATETCFGLRRMFFKEKLGKPK